jgi:signal transduction histidine kinase
MFKKGLVIIAVPFLFQLVFLVALWRVQADITAAQGLAIHTKDVISQAETVARLVAEAQSSVRGLIVTGERSLSETYTLSAGRVPGALKSLRELVADNKGQQARVDAISARIGPFLARLDEAHRLAAAGRTEEATGRAEALVRDRAGEAVRGEIDVFLAEEGRLDADRRGALGRKVQRQNLAILAGAVLSAAAAVAMVLAFSRGFARRVAVLDENARRLSEGEPLAAPIGGDDELSRLDDVFHAVAASVAEKDRENEMFIYSVSHDLRSPLVNLQGFSRELDLTCDDLRRALAGAGVGDETRRRVDRLLDHDMGTSIRYIRSAVTRLSSIIDALLRLSRAGRVEYRWQTVDVAAAVARVAEALRSTAAERNAEVLVGDLPPAAGDPTAVEQVFANLVGNALNYLDPGRPGRIEVGAAAEGGDGEPGARPGAGFRTYYVKDNGLGIPRAYQDKLFSAFQRLNPDAAPGEGIGLALTRRVVERHGGKVWFESEEGRGSTFYVTLPAPTAAERATAANGAADVGPVPGRKGATV